MITQKSLHIHMDIVRLFFGLQCVVPVVAAMERCSHGVALVSALYITVM